MSTKCFELDEEAFATCVDMSWDSNSITSG